MLLGIVWERAASTDVAGIAYAIAVDVTLAHIGPVRAVIDNVWDAVEIGV